MSLFKIIMALGSIVVYIIITSYLYMGNTVVQACLLIFVLAIFAVLISVKELIAELRLVIWLALSMLAIVTLLALLNIDEIIFKLIPFTKVASDKSMSFLPRFLRGANIVLNLIHTIFFIRMIFSFIRVEDFLKIQMGIKYLKWLLLGKLLFAKGNCAIQNIEFYVSQFPNLKTKKEDNIVKRWRTWFRKNLIVLLALIFYIMQEATVRGELIDNRIEHCFLGEVNHEG